jgi:hypothetical protein
MEDESHNNTCARQVEFQDYRPQCLTLISRCHVFNNPHIPSDHTAAWRRGWIEAKMPTYQDTRKTIDPAIKGKTCHQVVVNRENHKPIGSKHSYSQELSCYR